MPRVIITEGATEGLERCRKFLATKAPEAARRAGQAIAQQFQLLETAPDVGRPLPDMPELREMVIAFGDSGYVALYRHDPAQGRVYVLAFRHQKEAGY
ncbi:MAG: type II toxin-antitoxin system RelE/ParE family toxin [Acidiferrobacter sp.]